MRTRLENGDVVRIIRGGQPEPQPDWEHMVVTGRARSAVRKLVKQVERDEYVRLGELYAARALEHYKKALTDEIMTGVIKRLGLETHDAVFEKLGRAEVSRAEFWRRRCRASMQAGDCGARVT